MQSLAVGVVLLGLFSVSAAKDELQVGDLIKQHLDSIGSEQARAAAKSRVAQGTVHFGYVTGGVGTQDGKQVFVPKATNWSRF